MLVNNHRRRLRRRLLLCCSISSSSSSSGVTYLTFVFLCSLTTFLLMALLWSRFFPTSKLARNPLQTHQEIAIDRSGGELSWTTEPFPPLLTKESLPLRKTNSMETTLDLHRLWKRPSTRNFIPCVEPVEADSCHNGSRGYLMVHTNGGLNQMRAGISDMVAVARIMNATLVVPELDKQSFWQDSSNFSDVFDEEHFITALANDIEVVKKLPAEKKKAPRVEKHFISWSGVEYYKDEISPLLENYAVIEAAKSDSRLANNNLPLEIQKLRCRAFYKALRFSPKIEAMGELLVNRMRAYGPYIALHLRYEKDMLAFSGCTYGLSPNEADELTNIRLNTPHWKVKDIDAGEQRERGYCPLTPREVGLFLSALGYPSGTPIYVAAGEIYGGDSHMTDLKSRFPLLMSKETLASTDELAPFVDHASQMAALDYIVSVESDVFVPSYSGNMARAAEGHRRFLGHRKTISPDRKSLIRLFDRLDRGTLKPSTFSTLVVNLHKKRQGSPRKRKGPISGTRGKDRFRSEEVFYENPLPECLCEQEPTDTVFSFKSSSSNVR